MVCRHPTASTAGSPSQTAGKDRKRKRSVITLDEFTSSVYLPHIEIRNEAGASMNASCASTFPRCSAPES